MPSLPFEYGIFFEISHVVFVRRMKIEEKVITQQLKSSVMNFFYMLCEEFEVIFKNLQNLEKSQNRFTFSS